MDVQSDDEGSDTSMDECSDEEDAHGQPTLEIESTIEHQSQYVESQSPPYPIVSTSTMIECMAEYFNPSLWKPLQFFLLICLSRLDVRVQ